MAKLIFCRGLPGSGKTTYARVLEQQGWVRVNKDDIRIALGMDRKTYKREQEFAVVDHRDHLICEALNAGKNVISDDTNFGKKHEPRLRQLATQFNAEFVMKDFTDVPIETCIARDAVRDDTTRVGDTVIWGMAETHLGLKRPVIASLSVAPYVVDDTLPQAVICDLDGTLAIHNGRSPYDFEQCDTDKLNVPVYHLLWAMAAAGTKIIYLSGRDDSVQSKTENWLRCNSCPEGPLFMRKTGDTRKDCIVKSELFDREIRGKYQVVFCIDDRDQVVALWRAMGLTCLQANYGSF